MIIDERHGPSIPDGLTELPDKRELYALDSYFWEGWEDLKDVAGNEARAVATRHSLLLLKPDAVASRKLHIILEWLIEQRFTIAAAMPMRLNRHSIRLMWQYQWNIARRERKDACDILLPATDSLLLIIASPKNSERPASRLFADLKGPADPTLRRPGQLRFVLGKRSTLLNFVHSADDPADFVREMAICLAASARRNIFKTLLETRDAEREARALIEKMYGSVPEHQLDLQAAMLHLRQSILGAFPNECDRDNPVWPAFSDIERGTSTDWRRLFALLDAENVRYNEWDKITIACHLIKMDYDEWQVLLPSIRFVDGSLATVGA